MAWTFYDDRVAFSRMRAPRGQSQLEIIYLSPGAIPRRLDNAKPSMKFIYLRESIALRRFMRNVVSYLWSKASWRFRE